MSTLFHSFTRDTALASRSVSAVEANRMLRLHRDNHLVQKDVNGGPAEMLNPISVVASLRGKLVKSLKKRVPNLTDPSSQNKPVMGVMLIQVVLGNLDWFLGASIRKNALLQKVQQLAVCEWAGMNAGYNRQLLNESERLGVINRTHLGI